ncbi:restriction endonuclease [Nonomuraea fastidiosa]|uniref:restriction endonuclease n=1 Tax=Nonomuraea TaxID=83681 RepID=UPI00324A74BF
MARGSKRSRRQTPIVAAGAIGVAAVWFAAEHPGWAAAAGGLLVLLLAAALLLRRRVIEAGRRRFLAANAELERIDRLSGSAFEHLVAERMRADGFRQVRERGGAGDGGVDIVAVAPGPGRLAVQCKRYSRPVGAAEVREFLGALANSFAGHTGVLITSSRLTRQARQEAQGARDPLIVVERDHLADWLLGEAPLLPGGRLTRRPPPLAGKAG